MLLLVAVSSLPPLVYAFALTYGGANGLLTIAKATLPVEMFGLANVGAVLGRFSAPSLVARALAPFAFAVLSGAFGVERGVLGLSAISLACCVVYVAATRDVSMQAAGRR